MNKFDQINRRYDWVVILAFPACIGLMWLIATATAFGQGLGQVHRQARGGAVQLQTKGMDAVDKADPVTATPDDDDDIEIQLGEYGIEWCVVGDVDNLPFPGNRWNGAFKGYGIVPYPFRIARTELTVEDYYEFVVAYTPYYDGNPLFQQFLGWYIFGGWDGEKYNFAIQPGLKQAAQTLQLRLAARYCNWLHNDKIIEEWAFDTGCYDASTFGFDENFDPTDDYTRLPGAKYWIPLAGEMLKATYFDPNRFGQDDPGWWLYPNRSDEPMRLGLPWYPGSFDEGGQTNGGMRWYWPPGPAYGVGLYPLEQSAYGLLDTSGGEFETGLPLTWSSSLRSQEDHVQSHDEAGRALYNVEVYPNEPIAGLRLASPFPKRFLPVPLDKK